MSKGYFFFWVVLSFIWGLTATAAMVILPVAETFFGNKLSVPEKIVEDGPGVEATQ